MPDFRFILITWLHVILLFNLSGIGMMIVRKWTRCVHIRTTHLSTRPKMRKGGKNRPISYNHILWKTWYKDMSRIAAYLPHFVKPLFFPVNAVIRAALTNA